MLRLKRWIAAILAVCLLINTIPVYTFAETEEPTSTVEPTSEVTEPSSTEQSASEVGKSISEVIEPASEDPETTQTSQENQQENQQQVTNQEAESQETESQVITPQETTEGTTSETAGENGDEPVVEVDISDPFALKFEQVLSNNTYDGVIRQYSDGQITLTIGQGQGEILALLSQQEQTADSNYQNWIINFNFTGVLSLPNTFLGLGDWGETPEKQFPFKGKFTNQAITITTSKTLFKALDASADLHGNSINWEIGPNDATPTIPILANVLVADNSKRTINMPLASATRFNPYIGQLTGGNGMVTLPTLNYANVGTSPAVEYPGDVGLVCGSMNANTNLQVGAVTLSSVPINLMSVQNVGSLVGSMGEGAKLTITEDLTLNATLNGVNTGGLVGSMTNSTIDVTQGKNVTVNATLTATGAAGGIASTVETVTGPLDTNANVVLQSVKANGSENSGVLYGTCAATGAFNPLAGVSFGATREVSGPGNCGGLFGTLTLSGEGKCTLSAAEGQTLEITTSLADATNDTSYGGIAGTLTGERVNALIIENCTITPTVNVDTETAKYPKYLGGIVAKQETATVDARNSTINVKSPKTATATDCGFGGVTAYLGDNALLIADGMTIITDSYSANPGGGGVVGSAHKGSIVYLKTSLDLSECQLSTNATSGQIVGSQDCSLIYAPGVGITRLKTGTYSGMELDDIGNYGELYRIQDFLSVNENTYETTLPNITGTDNAYTLSDKKDYACLALAWQSRGYFPTISGIDSESWSSPSSITLGADIDLTGCGIGGLTRDVYSADDTFTGTFIGGDKTLTMDIGATNVANGVTTGDGRIYWHNATGLFAAIDNKATVSNLTLAGSIRLSNNKLTSVMSCGALAAQVTTSANAGQSILTAVSTKVNFDAICSGSNYILYLGGLFGQISAGHTTQIDFGTESTLAPKISITYNSECTGSYNHFGGAIGAISGKGAVNITCNGATIGGGISNQGSNNPYNMYVGGLVGTIWSGSTPHSITIQNLTVSQFSVTGSASQRMSGILGGIWAGTDVTIDGLTVANTTLTASGAAELGGLVYRASGKWTVSSADLSGLIIKANDASALGLLVCHGEPYTEPINGTQKVGGLYLEMTKHWDTAYTVPSADGSITFNGSVFDEFLAYTAYRSSDTSYDITHNGSGIISLKTDNGTVNMTSGERNTYVNRTTVGQSKKTNPYSRYYYNLDSVKSGLSNANDTTVDSAQELLIWSVWRYADTSLQHNFSFGGVNTISIGGDSAGPKATFDMEGLSYYPINITSESVTVQYADVKFYNSAIESKETTAPENKSTRSTATSHSQHYTMHCALFLNFTAENITKTENYTMTINGVSFAGTVGVVDGGSGALLCGNVKGESTSGNTATCTVVLADEDASAKAVSLNGLSVTPAGDYTPALVNQFGSYAGLTANYVTTTDKQTMKAGSSLIGDVGGADATHVTVTFGGTIKLPEASSGDHQVFTKATLLNSLRYADGSATYTFESTKDNGEHDTTHGYELSESVEYAGKCGFYDDDTDSTKQVLNSEKKADFKSYLPYVANSPAIDEINYPLSGKWHELAVNIHSEPLTNGCGTYGHPYQVTAKELREAANYINTGVAFTGWQVRIPDGTSYHNSGEDILLTYKNGGWKKEDDSAYTGDVRKHLQSAYYQLVYAKDENGTEETSITLNNFPGIGTNPDWAFKGVITGKIDENNNVSVTLTGGSSAFIKYSYGSVVRDVNIQMGQSLSLTHVYPTTTNNITAAQQAPSTFFGGVIGCVLGGDNILDGVRVTVSNSFNLTLNGTNAYLIPVGGYVGVIAGGGVIFRGSCTSSYTGDANYYYCNPIIGRVLGGYAFYEGSETAPNNTDKNYTINTITPPTAPNKDLSWDGSTLTVNTAQGLLILSAIVSSGAGSTESNAYKNGVARNATYKEIGADTEPDDYVTAKNDAGEVWKNANTPYLLTKYASYSGNASICTGTDNGIDIRFKKDSTFDMSSYGNGYRGLSARYVSNAAFSGSEVTPSAVVMRVKTFDGQNATVQNIKMDVKEYNNDDFHMASMGGIFNIVWTQKQSGGGDVGSNFAQNLTLQDCNVSLKYVDSNGGVQNEADITTFSNEDGRRAVSVGGFIGMANDVDAVPSSIKHNYLFTNIRIEGTGNNKCKIYGPNGVGGLIGTTAMASTGVTGYTGKLLADGKWALFGPNFLNCSYSNIEVTGGMAAGGLIGDAYANSKTTIPNFYGLGLAYSNGDFKSYTSCTVTDKDLIVGQNATITASAKSSIAGGLFGGAGMRVGVNDPEVNTKSGITTVNNVSNICTLKLSNVKIQVSTTDYDPGVADRADNSINNAYAAGIIGRIGNVNPSCFYDIQMNDGSVTAKEASSSLVGGIQGSGYTNSQISIQRCTISSFKVSGKNAGGFLGNGKTASGFSLHMSDCKLVDSKIYGTTTAGGLVGDAYSSYYLYNILIKDTTITKNDKDANGAGRLFGQASSISVEAAGVSVFSDPSKTIATPTGEIGSGSYSTGYIAYADYVGTETTVEGTQSPYVTVNPNYTLTGTDKTLYGDAVGKITDDTYGSVAARIWADSKTGATSKKNLASYANVSAIVNAAGKTAPEVSTFREVQGYTADDWGKPADLPVLVLKGNDASAIEDYLNVITNGGYGEANVTPTVSVYYFDKGTKNFSEATDQLLKANPASIYYENGQFHIRSRSFDNTLNRFSLVEASFTVKVNGVDRTYTVSVPVVVIRELQFDFMATFSYGREFQKNTFADLRTHLLESTGNPFTAYLTYQYNREKGQYVEYDWQSYMDDGGSMLAVDKVLNFSSGLPDGTQMILVDCQSGNQAYQYTTSGANTKEVKLSSFTSLADGTTMFRSSMAETLGVTSEQSASGKYVIEADKTKATIRLKEAGTYVYYRLATDSDVDKECFKLTVPDLSKTILEENYYLVITVPTQEGNPDYYINGSLSSTLNWSMPSSGTQLHRYDPAQIDNRNNTESTYQISTGYRQELISTAVSGEPINLGDANQKMQVKVQDTITFSNGQTYDANDKLFLKLTVNLQECTTSEGNTQSEEKQFPVGTTGTVKFYVKDADGKHYTMENGTWKSNDIQTVAASYDWSSQGGNMELLLSTDGKTALDLSGVRQMIKGNQSAGDSQIIVTAEMEVDFGSAEVLNAAVPGSEKAGTDTWAQLYYLGQISTQETSLSYSAMRETAEDNAKYYRSVKYQAVLSMDAMYIDQLGVNPLQLVQDYQENIGGKNASRIDLTAALNLANLQNIESILQNTNSITFTLSLQRKDDGYIANVSDASNYIAFDKGTFDDTKNSWSWTILKYQYYNNGAIVTNDIFDGTQFTFPIKAYVFTDQKDYANYKITLTATFSTSDKSNVTVNADDAYVVYTYACIKPSFYEPQSGGTMP